jgi:hypothetical protein
MPKDYNPNPQYNPYRVRKGPQPARAGPTPAPAGRFIDFDNQRVCPSCGKVIKRDFNFCKFCGVDLSEVEPLAEADDIIKHLSITAVTDPDPSVRKESLDTLGGFKDKKVLGLLTYILLNDPDPAVRKEAADELGDIAHPYSQNVLASGLKDESPIVRKECIEGLKKIKQKHKEKEVKKGKDRLDELEDVEEIEEIEEVEEIEDSHEEDIDPFEDSEL